MERDQIIREDFEVVRKGWDPDAVRAHLRAVAETQSDRSGPSLGDVAAERIRSVIEAAEGTAAEIEASSGAEAEARLSAAEAEAEDRLSAARAEAERMTAEAEAESADLLGRARAEAEAQVADASGAVDGLAEQVSSLRVQVAEIGDRLREAAPSSPAPVAEVPGPVIVPEPTPPTIPEPSPDPVPEPTPDPVPEPSPDPTPEPPAPDLPDEPGPLEPPVPESTPPPATATETASTEDLIAQLQSASTGAGAANGSASAAEPAASSPDVGAARLVAMNMALEGASREQISSRLEADFGDVPDVDGLLDEVLARAQR